MARRKPDSIERRRAYVKAWRAAHPDRVKAIKRRHYERHKERLKAQTNANRKRQMALDPDGYRAKCREAARKRWHKDRENHRLAAIARRYGLAPDAYHALAAAQHHACAICQTPFDQIKRLCVDHNHRTGAVRGLLCNGCNVGVAHLGDDPARIIAAANYLLHHT